MARARKNVHAQAALAAIEAAPYYTKEFGEDWNLSKKAFYEVKDALKKRHYGKAAKIYLGAGFSTLGRTIGRAPRVGMKLLRRAAEREEESMENPARKNPMVYYTLLWEHRSGKHKGVMGLPGAESIEIKREKDYTGRLEPLEHTKARLGYWASVLRRQNSVPYSAMMVLDRHGNELELEPFLELYRRLGRRVLPNPSRARRNTSAASVSLYQDILAHLRAIQWLAWAAHWTAKGPNFYGDHLLLERLYGVDGGDEGPSPNIVEEIDQLGERMVAYFGAASVDPTALNRKVTDLLAKSFRDAGGSENANPLMGLCLLENSLQGAIRRAWKENQLKDGAHSLGLDDFLMALANERDTARYLLGRRLGLKPLL